MPPTGRSIFINCPFDSSYSSLFDALIFSILDCGFIPRCALENADSSEVRLDKIGAIIRQCDYSIHDRSYAHLDPISQLPRFNMPFELGLCLGYKRFAGKRASQTRVLILDSDSYRYRKLLSDIAGQDIFAHQNEPRVAIKRVRDWLRTESGVVLPHGDTIYKRYTTFRDRLPQICAEYGLESQGMTLYSDYVYAVKIWLESTPADLPAQGAHATPF